MPEVVLSGEVVAQDSDANGSREEEPKFESPLLIRPKSQEILG